MSEANTKQERWRSALPWALASVVCSYGSAFMQWLYIYYHWNVVVTYPPWDIPDHIHDAVFAMFDIIHVHKVFFAAAATGFAIACLRHRPRWIGLSVLIPALFLLITAISLVT